MEDVPHYVHCLRIVFKIIDDCVGIERIHVVLGYYFSIPFPTDFPKFLDGSRLSIFPHSTRLFPNQKPFLQSKERIKHGFGSNLPCSYV